MSKQRFSLKVSSFAAMFSVILGFIYGTSIKTGKSLELKHTTIPCHKQSGTMRVGTVTHFMHDKVDSLWGYDAREQDYDVREKANGALYHDTGWYADASHP